MMKRDLKREYYLSHCCEISERASSRVSKVLNIASFLPSERFLDIGCSEGTLTSLLSQTVNAKEVYGIELSPLAIRQASDKGIKVKQLDIETDSLPFGDEYFDLIFCGDLIEHLFNSSNLLTETHRCLKRGAFFLSTTPNLVSWDNRLSCF